MLALFEQSEKPIVSLSVKREGEGEGEGRRGGGVGRALVDVQ